MAESTRVIQVLNLVHILAGGSLSGRFARFWVHGDGYGHGRVVAFSVGKETPCIKQ